MTNAEKLDYILEWIGQQRKPSVADPEVLRRLGVIETLIREQNGSLKKHGEVLAMHGQWIKGHDEQVHPALDAKVDSIGTRTNWIGSLNATLTALVGGLVMVIKGK